LFEGHHFISRYFSAVDAVYTLPNRWKLLKNHLEKISLRRPHRYFIHRHLFSTIFLRRL